jgi:methyl-accepting chemotaxis protein
MQVLLTQFKGIYVIIRTNKYLSILLKYLQPVGIIGGIVVSIFSGSIPFGIVTFILTISYVISLLIIDKKNTSTITEKEPTTTSAGESKVNDVDFKAYLSELEGYFDVSVRSKFQIIPVLTEQLQSVISQTDEAAGGLTGAFIGISRQAKKQLQAVQGLFGNISEQTSDNNILFQTQENLHEIQANFLTLTSFFDNSIKMISEVLEQLHKVDAFASNIEKIGKTTNILALNASIEAARSGEAGLGFKVIASEIKALSKKSNDSIKEITDITVNLTSQVNAIKQELQSVHEHSKSIGISTDELFSMTTEKIGATLQDTAEKIKVIASDAEGLTKEISKVVVSIQFQDITRQRIEHVISPLEMLNSEIMETIDKLIKKEIDFAQASNASTSDSLMDQYTMESEREILNKLKNQSN